jgi:hypothetical protein
MESSFAKISESFFCFTGSQDRPVAASRWRLRPGRSSPAFGVLLTSTGAAEKRSRGSGADLTLAKKEGEKDRKAAAKKDLAAMFSSKTAVRPLPLHLGSPPQL